MMSSARPGASMTAIGWRSDMNRQIDTMLGEEGLCSRRQQRRLLASQAMRWPSVVSILLTRPAVTCIFAATELLENFAPRLLCPVDHAVVALRIGIAIVRSQTAIAMRSSVKPPARLANSSTVSVLIRAPLADAVDGRTPRWSSLLRSSPTLFRRLGRSRHGLPVPESGSGSAADRQLGNSSGIIEGVGDR